MNTLFLLLFVQVVLGAFDNVWHHELHARLPQRVSAVRELVLHAWREAIYGLVFIGLAWFEWRGLFAPLLAGLLLVEILITFADFIEEDRTRRLPPFERTLHTMLTVSYGIFLGTLAPVLLDWGRQPSELFLVSYGGISWAFSLFGLGVLAWALRDALAALRLGREARKDFAQDTKAHDLRLGHAAAPAVLVTGATGFIGSALVANLRREGRRVIVLSRDERAARASFGQGVWIVESLDAIPPETRIDAVVNLAGARVLGMPWTQARRRELIESRTRVTAAVVAFMRRLEHAPRVLVSASAVGYYGATPGASFEARDESSPARPGEFQSDLCAAVEHEARRAEALKVRVVWLRFGIVLGRRDGAYPRLALAARLGLGTVLGSGLQPAPWIHLDDAIGLIGFAMAREDVEGPLNAVAPDVPQQLRFAGMLAASFGRRAWLRVPAKPMRALAGEMATLLLDGQNAVPRAALAAGYAFRFPALKAAFADLARREALAQAVC